MVVLLILRSLVAMGSAVFVWLCLLTMMGGPVTLLDILLPVWIGGFTGGVICSVFSLRLGPYMAFGSGVMLAIAFIIFRQGYLGLPLGEDTMRSLWPLWFPPAFYLGAYAYLRFQLSSG
ncbi:hypothetical protein OAL14_05960 [Gammaproteobacteria bacterium]|nr:hypothetical protein [Gammaproteobacteria bacterium]